MHVATPLSGTQNAADVLERMVVSCLFPEVSEAADERRPSGEAAAGFAGDTFDEAALTLFSMRSATGSVPSLCRRGVMVVTLHTYIERGPCQAEPKRGKMRQYVNNRTETSV